MPILALLTLLVVVGILVMIQAYSKNRMPSANRQLKEEQALKEDMASWASTLVPLDKEELDVFSLSQDKQVVKTSMGGTQAKGIFTTIFQEPVVAYAYKRYLGEKVNELLVAKTAEHEYVYWTKDNESLLKIDGQEVGKISENILYGAKSGKEIGRIKSMAQDNFLPVQIGNRDVGALNTKRPTKENALSERAFEFIPDDLSPQEEQLFLALATRELVKQSLAAE